MKNINSICVNGDLVTLTIINKKQQSFIVYFDLNFLETLGTKKWFIIKNGPNFYAVTKVKRAYKFMTHFIFQDIPKGFVIDHINGHTLDNRMSNLRVCTIADNTRNRSKQTSRFKYKGVQLRVDKKKYTSRIKFSGKTYCLGSYETQDEAAKAYNEAALKYFGEFARLNTIPEIDCTNGISNN